MKCHVIQGQKLRPNSYRCPLTNSPPETSYVPTVMGGPSCVPSQSQKVRSSFCSAKKKTLGTNFSENELVKRVGHLGVPAQCPRIPNTLNHLEPVSADGVKTAAQSWCFSVPVATTVIQHDRAFLFANNEDRDRLQARPGPHVGLHTPTSSQSYRLGHPGDGT